MGTVRESEQAWADFRAECLAGLAMPQPALSRERPVLVFGAGQFGRDVYRALADQGFDVAGFVETRPRQETLMGLPVLSWEQAGGHAGSAQLAIGVFNRGAPFDGLHALARSAGFDAILMPWDLYGPLRGELGWRYWLASSTYLADHLDQLEQTYWRLADVQSRSCLLELCRFRMGRNLGYAGFAHPERQYFNPLTLAALPDRPVVYVDGGAYNGDTLAEFSACHAIAAAYLFEPDAQNFAQLTGHCRRLPFKSVCLPLALAGGYEMLAFDGGNGEAGTIGASGTSTIAAVALDDVLAHERVDFLKLDVEGAEIAALNGAATLIGRDRPVLALSIYHHPHDLWAIPARVLSLCADYRLFLRQHHANSFDAVLYAVA